MNRDDLLAHLAAIDFSTRYYALCAGRSALGAAGLDLPTALAATEATWARKRGFHRTEQDVEGVVFAMNVAETRGKVEAILDVATAAGVPLGGPFPALAYDVGELADPAFAPQPPYPKVSVRTQEDLEAIVVALHGLYQDAWAQLAEGLASR